MQTSRITPNGAVQACSTHRVSQHSNTPSYRLSGGLAAAPTATAASSNSQLLFSSYRDAGVLGVVEADLRLLLRTNLALVGGSSSLGTHS